ncbi:MAG: hypothetical protein WBX25_33660 [Rhodomicrobium sp.]
MRFLNAGPTSRTADRLLEAYGALKKLSLGPHPREYVKGLDAGAAAAIAKTLIDGINAVKRAFADIEEMRSFVSPQSLATLRTWGKEPGCPYPIYVEKSYRAFFIGKDRPGFVIKLDETFDETLGV